MRRLLSGGGVAKYKLCGRPGRGVITLRTKADSGGGEGGELIDFFADVLYGWSLSIKKPSNKFYYITAYSNHRPNYYDCCSLL